MSASDGAEGVDEPHEAGEARSKRVPTEQKDPQFWTRAIRRRASDEDIRERPNEQRHWMRYFRRMP